MKNKLITTSIAYVNAEPHIGFLLELLAADVLKRHYGEKDVFLLTGTDEHGVKVAASARAANKEPQAFVDEIAAKFEQLGAQFNIKADFFIRTTNPEHLKFVQEKWRQLKDAGVLKKKSYRGLYCPGCEAFKTSAEVEDAKCLIHKTDLEKVDEENWFLVIDEILRKKIKDWIEECVFPATRRQEVINVLNSGAYDEVSVSRPRDKTSWGVSVPEDDSQVMYVWVDALFNYISALRITNNEGLWPADTQIIGKDILKFHAIIWPALLISTDYKLPKKLLVHGFINVDGQKMSKSLGNVVTPQQLLDRYGLDASRYLLLRQLNFFDDSNFVWSEFDAIYNGELANGLGNLVSRLVGIGKKVEGINIASDGVKKDVETEFDFRKRLEESNLLIKRADGIVTENKLWENSSEKVTAFQEAIKCLQEAAELLRPIMPDTANEIGRQLTELDPKPLFPRLG